MSIAFVVVFAIFVALILGLAVISIRWAHRRDRAARAARAATGAGNDTAGSTTTGTA